MITPRVTEVMRGSAHVTPTAITAPSPRPAKR
jgi:hypothetical protein